jgi:hypothetical protein
MTRRSVLMTAVMIGIDPHKSSHTAAEPVNLNEAPSGGFY